MKQWPLLLGALAMVGFGIYSRIQLGHQADGSYLVSNGQSLRPIGLIDRIEGSRPKDMAQSSDGKYIAVLAHSRLLLYTPDGKRIAETQFSAGPLGIGWSPDGQKIYCTQGNGKIAVFQWQSGALIKSATLEVESVGAKGNPGTAGLTVSSNGDIFVALSIRNKVVRLTPEGVMINSWDVGACPYHVLLSHSGDFLAVSNRGGTVVTPAPEQGDPITRTAFQGSGVASAQSAGTAIQIDPRTDAALVGSVSFISVSHQLPVSTVNVGRQPAGLTFSQDDTKLFVADSDEDAISVVDVQSFHESRKIPITPKDDRGFGQIPTDVQMDSTGNRLLVTLGGANAIAVVQLGIHEKVVGYLPTAWYPIKLLVTNQRISVACAKGIGSRPNSKSGGYGVHDSVGVYETIAADSWKDLSALTRIVSKNNGWGTPLSPRKNKLPIPIPERIGEPSVFTHVVYIIKENLTYDIAMGDIASGNGDPSLCVFPANVSPNHHKLAERFGLLDNFYISGTNSADGHQWVDSSIANDYTERNYSANSRSYPYDGNDPLAYSPSGFLWNQAIAAGKSVRVFGEFVSKPSIIDTKTGKSPSWLRCYQDYKSGKGEILIKAETAEARLRDTLDPNYIGFPMTVTDQWRADIFLSQLRGWEKTDTMPNLSILLLPNDHTGGLSPQSPTPRAQIADNDLALGRIIEGISRSRFWGNTLVIVAEDDSQNGLDHVDGHRSICFCISAYSRAVTNSSFYNHSSIAATIERVLGLPPMTRFDRVSKPMIECFDSSPNLAPYVAAPNQISLDELNPPARKNLTKLEQQLAEACSKMDWKDPDVQDQRTLNRSIWASEAKRSVGRAGYSVDFPPALR